MLVFALRRLAVSILTLLLTATITFSLIHLIPGNPVQVILGVGATPAEVRTLTAQLRLNLPIAQQYVDWMAATLTGHLGSSIVYHQPVLGLIAQAMPRTVELSLVCLILSLLVAVPLGLYSGLTARLRPDRIISAATTLGVVVPGFVWGLVLIYVFVLRLHWTTITGIANSGTASWLNPLAYLLPAISLALGLIPSVTQVLRAETQEVARADYIRTARMMGFSGLRIAIHDVLRNSVIPVTTHLGTQIGFLLSGVVIIENIFSIPGMGNLLVSAVFNRDYPVILGCVVVLGAIVIVINLLVDLAYAVLDPRISYR
jgi:peptide/nickel transport system permease protein